MFVNNFRLALLALLVTSLNACQRDRKFASNGHMKRAATPRAPLSPDEQLIVSSFDANSIDDWSYYYTHGLHVAGHNKTMAQWTVRKPSKRLLEQAGELCCGQRDKVRRQQSLSKAP